MTIQHMLHTSVQFNDFELRLAAIKKSIPLFFFYNMQNYARYGSFYVEVLSSLTENFPGLKEQLSNAGLSIQAQKRYPHRTPIDMRGEQTINREAKTAGGVTQFAASTESVRKWCLNRYM